ncbi:MAG: hypothetical protein ACOC5A_02940 [Halanaerobiales bacterium]
MGSDFKKLIEEKKSELQKKSSKNSTARDTDKYISREKAVSRIYKRIIENSNIPPKFRSVSFETFNFDAAPAKNVRKVKQIKVYAENILTAIKGPQSLYIYSSYNGSGKTHVAVSVLKTAARKFAEKIFEKNPLKYSRRGVSLQGFNRCPVFFMSEVNYLWKKRKYNTSSEKIKEEVDLIEQAVMDSDLLVIDDFFSERDTDFVFGNLTAWLNHRYDYNKPVIFTSNDNFKILALDNEKNPYYGTRYMKNATYLASRISEMTKGYQFAFHSSRDDDYRQNSY